MAPKTFLVTGSSAGFGLAFCRLILAKGHNVIATSRNPAKNQDLVDSINDDPSGRGRWIRLDVTSSQASITKTFAEASKIFGPIDVLINNAGYSVMGGVEDMDEEKARQQFDTNYWGVMRTIKAVLPTMRERRGGTIVNVSSIAGLNALATAGVYAGSKFALEAMSEALSLEVASFGIRVLLVEPGAFKTNFLSADATVPMPVSQAYKGTIVETFTKHFKELEGKQKGDTDKGVSRIYDAIMGEGWGKGKEQYLRLLIGADCYQRASNAVREKLENVEAMKEIAESTDFDA